MVVIDGCSLFCHGRIAENIINRDKLVVFDSLSIHRKYADLMNIDDVPEEERKQAAREVADKVLVSLGEGIQCCPEQLSSCECAGLPQAESTCFG